MKIIKLVTVIICCLSLCGCWDSVPIEECAHPVIGGYDVPQNGGQGVTVTGIYYQSLAGEPVNAEIISLTESSIGETRHKRSGYNFESWSTSMLSALIYGQDLATNGLWPYVDIMYRNSGSSATIKMAVAQGRAEKILKESSPEETVRAAYITNVVLTADSKSLLPSMDIVNFVKDYYTPGCNSVLPIIGMDDEDKPVLSGGAVFKKDIMVGKLDQTQANTYVMLREPNSTGIVVYECDIKGEQCTVTVFCVITRDIKTQLGQNGLIFNIKLCANAEIMEISSQKSITLGQEELHTLSKTLDSTLQRRIEDYLNYTHKELGLDNIGLAREVLARDRQNTERYDNAEFWQNAQTTVDVQSEVEAFAP